MKVLYMNNKDICQLLLKHNGGARREAGRCLLGVNMGDAGVMNEVVQARFNPSAGQRALQAGEQVLPESMYAAEGEDAEDAEDAEQVEPQAFEPQAENCVAPRDLEPQAPPNAVQQALAIEDIQNGEPGGPADMRGPAEMSLQLRNIDKQIQLQRKQHEWSLEAGAWRKDPEWRDAYKWDIEHAETKLSLKTKELEFRAKEFEQRKKEEEWEIEKKEKIAASNKKLKEFVDA
jgi:hypothetical protein